MTYQEMLSSFLAFEFVGAHARNFFGSEDPAFPNFAHARHEIRHRRFGFLAP